MQLLVRYDYTFCHCDFEYDFNAVKTMPKIPQSEFNFI